MYVELFEQIKFVLATLHHIYCEHSRLEIQKQAQKIAAH